jgi:hypothetical protein
VYRYLEAGVTWVATGLLVAGLLITILVLTLGLGLAFYDFIDWGLTTRGYAY